MTYLILTALGFCVSSINCRLPQTPRTPSTAAAHYFDDTFSRGNVRRKSSYAPKSPDDGRARLRRSSTSRSIGNHTLYSPSDTGADRHDALSPARRDSTAISDVDPCDDEGRHGPEEPRDDERRRSEADSHLEKYIGEQLNRVKSDEESVAVYEDEFEAQLD